MRRIVIALLFLAAMCPAPAGRAAPVPQPRLGSGYAVPLFGALVHPYDAPDNPYAPGHRGIDIAAPMGSPVRASAAGVVSFAGTVVGNLSVTIDHGGGIRTTYSYLATAAVKKGQTVVRGQVVGTVGRGHDDTLPPNVHLAARRDGVYFDPLELYVGSSYADLIRVSG